MKKIILVALIAAFVSIASSASATFLVEVYSYDSGIGSLEKAQSIIDDANGADYLKMRDVIDFKDEKDQGGNFNVDYSFGIDGQLDTFVFYAKTVLMVETEGYYTLGTNSDDGVQLSVDGAVKIANGKPHDNQDDFYSDYFSAGRYTLEILFYEDWGGASLELFATEGQYDTFSASGANFQLIDSNPGASIYATTPVPEPTTMLLFGAGLAGLAGVARKRRK